jgi:hypothetical protein
VNREYATSLPRKLLIQFIRSTGPHGRHGQIGDGGGCGQESIENVELYAQHVGIGQSIFGWFVQPLLRGETPCSSLIMVCRDFIPAGQQTTLDLNIAIS